MVKRLFVTVSCVVALFAFAAAAGEAAKKGAKPVEKPRIILKSVEGKYLAEDEGKVLETLICSSLAANKAYDVACPDDVNALLREQAMRMEMGVCSGTECGNADRMLKSDMIASAIVRNEDERYVMTVTLTSTASGVELSKASIGTAANVKALSDRVPDVIKDLYAGLSKPRPPEAAAPAQAPAEQKVEKKEAPAKSTPSQQEKK